MINEFKQLEGKDLDRLDTFDINPGNYLEIKNEGDMFRISGVNQIDQDGLESEATAVVSAAGT